MSRILEHKQLRFGFVRGKYFELKEMDYYTCGKCNALVPTHNKMLHSARCKGSSAPLLPNVSNRRAEVIDIVDDHLTESQEEEEDLVVINDNQASADDSSWVCDSCTFRNEPGPDVCAVCDAVPNERKNTIVQPFLGKNDSHWTCDICTLINDNSAPRCSACNEPRAGSTPDVDETNANVRSADPVVRSRLIDDDSSYDEADSADYFSEQHQPYSSPYYQELENQHRRLVQNAMLMGGLGGAGYAMLTNRNTLDGAILGASAGGIGAEILHAAAAATASANALQAGITSNTRNYTTRSSNNNNRQTTNAASSSARNASPSVGIHPVTGVPMGNSSRIVFHNGRQVEGGTVPDIFQMMFGGGAFPGLGNGAGFQFGDSMNIDGMSYQTLLDRFQQPVRSTDEEVLQSLPTHIFGADSRNRPTSSASHEIIDLCSDDMDMDMDVDGDVDGPTLATTSQQSRQSSTGNTTANSGSGTNEVPQCSVCMCEFMCGDNVKTLPCMHQFHSDCIDTWLRRSCLCPICKHSLR